MIPFLVYFVSIIGSFIIDLSHNIIEFEFLMRNLTILIIPLFVFTSNFSKIQILKIIKITSLLITMIGFIFLMIWAFGYYKYKNQEEYQKTDWFKSEIKTNINYEADSSIFEIIIPSSSKKPSLRKILMLNNEQLKNEIFREFFVKVKKSEKDVWILFRGVDTDDTKAWFNATTGEIGKIEGNAKVKSIKTSDSYYKFTLYNFPPKNTTREWYYISFVENNASYQWKNTGNENVILQLKEPKIYLANGQNLLTVQSILNYRIIAFGLLKSYAHATYFGFVFLFALVFLIFNNFYTGWVRFLSIILNIIVLFTLGSKAIIISFAFFLPIYYFTNNFKRRWIIIALVFGLFLIFYGQINQRFSQMFQTIINVNQTEEMGDLKTLSTNNRISIYKNYIGLMKANFYLGNGYKNGEQLINSKFNHNFNAHNQYLQSIFNSGILGLLSLIFFCLFPLFIKKNIEKERFDFKLLIIIILFNFLFESLLFRQWGLILVSFSFAIYYQYFKAKTEWSR